MTPLELLEQPYRWYLCYRYLSKHIEAFRKRRVALSQGAEDD